MEKHFHDAGGLDDDAAVMVVRDKEKVDEDASAPNDNIGGLVDVAQLLLLDDDDVHEIKINNKLLKVTLQDYSADYSLARYVRLVVSQTNHYHSQQQSLQQPKKWNNHILLDGDGKPVVQSPEQLRILRDVLINWALAPQAYKSTHFNDNVDCHSYFECYTVRPRSLVELVATVHTMFPRPSKNHPDEELYFDAWRPMTDNDNMKHMMNSKQFKRRVRQLQFLLLPGRLPSTLEADEKFACRILVDVLCDAVKYAYTTTTTTTTKLSRRQTADNNNKKGL